MKPTKEQIETAIANYDLAEKKRATWQGWSEHTSENEVVLFALTYLKLSMGEPSDEAYTNVGRACSNFVSGSGEYPRAKHVITPEYKNKTDYVLSLMQNGEGVSQYKLYQNHFYHGHPMPTRLSAVIFNLKKKHPVKKRTVKYFDKATGKHNSYAEYYI